MCGWSDFQSIFLFFGVPEFSFAQNWKQIRYQEGFGQGGSGPEGAWCWPRRVPQILGDFRWQEGKYVVDIDKDIKIEAQLSPRCFAAPFEPVDGQDCKPNTRIALTSDSYVLHKILPSKVPNNLGQNKAASVLTIPLALWFVMIFREVF